MRPWTRSLADTVSLWSLLTIPPLCKTLWHHLARCQRNLSSLHSRIPFPPRAPAPAFKSMKEYDEHEKKRRNRMRKGKKNSVHLAPSEMETTQNVQVFPEVSPNPISESGEPLFLEENSKVFPNSPSIINPKHPRAKYFKALIESLNLDDDEIISMIRHWI
jgi:hypothetical protein